MTDRPAILAAKGGAAPLVALSLIGWGLIIWAVSNMSSPLVALTMPIGSAWSAPEILAVSLMWTIMMAAMMLPSAIPMLLSHRSIVAKRAPGTETTSRWFLTGYLLAWTLFSLAAALLHWGLQHAGILSPMIRLQSAFLGGGILVLAGAFQFTPLKATSLTHCRNSTTALSAAWRNGRAGALRMGLAEGLCCITCCWALMLVLFVGGAMDLTTISVLTLVVAVERLAPKGLLIARIGGGAMIVWGLWLIESA